MFASAYPIWVAPFQVKKAGLDRTVLSTGSMEEKMQKIMLLPGITASVCCIHNDPINTTEYPLKHTPLPKVYIHHQNNHISNTFEHFPPSTFRLMHSYIQTKAPA